MKPLHHSRSRLSETKKRVLGFILLATLVCLGAGVYLKSSFYYGMGLLGIGLLLGGLIRWLFDRLRS